MVEQHTLAKAEISAKAKEKEFAPELHKSNMFLIELHDMLTNRDSFLFFIYFLFKQEKSLLKFAYALVVLFLFVSSFYNADKLKALILSICLLGKKQYERGTFGHFSLAQIVIKSDVTQVCVNAENGMKSAHTHTHTHT